jgi:hypothetical protein
MSTEDLIKEIQKLPISKRIFVLEKTIQSIRKHKEKESLENAAEELAVDYHENKELTEFTNLDFEEFYEAK